MAFDNSFQIESEKVAESTLSRTATFYIHADVLIKKLQAFTTLLENKHIVICLRNEARHITPDDDKTKMYWQPILQLCTLNDFNACVDASEKLISVADFKKSMQ